MTYKPGGWNSCSGLTWGRRSYTDGTVTVMVSTGDDTGDCVEVPVYQPPKEQ